MGKKGGVKICALATGDEQRVADLIHRSLVSWYGKNLGQGGRFGESSEPFLLFPRVYEALDPGDAVAAYGEKGELLGVCFAHARPTHYSVGIVATDPSSAGRGVARALLAEVLKRADREEKPVRLVSSLWSLDSYSLYTRMGFRPGAIYQDLQFEVPDTGLRGEVPSGVDRVRLAGRQDAEKIARFEQQLRGIFREKDWVFFLGKKVLDWRVWVAEDGSGDVAGVLVSGEHPHWGMLGPGVARDADWAGALVWRALGERCGRTTVLLVPARETELVRRLYAWGGRNLELHVAQVRGLEFEEAGIGFPTFLPETA
jgi:GNAT superfamily N-acetyltransferase